jgi:hypothetical protein
LRADEAPVFYALAEQDVARARHDRARWAGGPGRAARARGVIRVQYIDDREQIMQFERRTPSL